MQRRLRESVVWTILVACVAMCGAAEDNRSGCIRCANRWM